MQPACAYTEGLGSLRGVKGGECNGERSRVQLYDDGGLLYGGAKCASERASVRCDTPLLSAEPRELSRVRSRASRGRFASGDGVDGPITARYSISGMWPT